MKNTKKTYIRVYQSLISYIMNLEFKNINIKNTISFDFCIIVKFSES